MDAEGFRVARQHRRGQNRQVPIEFKIITAVLALGAGLSLTSWPWSWTRWLWSATCICAALTFARPVIEALGGVDPVIPRWALLVLGPASIATLLDIWRRTSRRLPRRLTLAAAAALSCALVAWPLYAVAPKTAAVLCYLPLWVLFGSVIRWRLIPPKEKVHA